MDPETIFSAALEQATPEERDAFLQEACGDNAALRAEIDALLAAHNDAGSFLERTPEELEATMSHPGSAESLDAIDEGAWRKLLEPSENENSLGQIGGYEVQELVGRGGMGVVYRARQRKLNRIVAVKTIVTGSMAGSTEIERFRREAEAAARLDHPGIVPVFEIGEESDVVFFSMGYVAGGSLAEHLRENTLTPSAAAETVRQLAKALQFAHDAGVLHRDLKPANVMLDEAGHPKLADFGLARMIDREGVTLTGAAVGTPSYMPPEQATGLFPIGPTSDVYGLGAILYACLCGHPPFRGPSTMATLNMVMFERPAALRQLRSDIPRDLETICEKCLEKYPSSRYQSAAELADELQRFLDDRPILARPVPVWTRLARWCRRKPLVAGLIGTVAVTLIAGIVVSSYFAFLARQRAINAELASNAAKQQSHLALRSLRTVIRSVQEQLKAIPETREVRRTLLVQVLDDLKEVSNGYIEQAEVDRESALALADLARLYTEIGDEAGTGVVALSDSHFRRSAEMYLELLDVAPDDTALAKTAFETILEYGNTAREYTQFEQAVWAHTQGRRIAMQWHTRTPTDPDAQLAYLQSSEALGEAMLRSGKARESRAYILDAVRLAEDYCAAHPDVTGYYNLRRCYCTAGDMHRVMKEFPEAKLAYEKMCATSDTLDELDPRNPQNLCDRSADFERLGDFHMALKDLPQARKDYEESLRLAVAYIADDPTNLFRLQQSTWCYSKLANVCKAQGDTEREAWSRQKLAEIRRTLKGR